MYVFLKTGRVLLVCSNSEVKIGHDDGDGDDADDDNDVDGGDNDNDAKDGAYEDDDD